MIEHIKNSRLEAFCDGIFAIAITLLILEIKVPELGDIGSADHLAADLAAQWPSWFAFLLSFLTLLIAWANHHNMLSQLNRTSSLFIYANGLLMLTVVIFPYSTSVLGRFLNTAYLTLPVVLYCFTNFIHNLGWLAVSVVATHPKDLTKDARRRANVQRTFRAIAIACAFNFLVTILAFWLPIPALLLVTTAWIAYLFSGIFQTTLE